MQTSIKTGRSQLSSIGQPCVRAFVVCMFLGFAGPSHAQNTSGATPTEQTALVTSIEKARRDYAEASNDFKKGKVRRQRAKAFCKILKKTGYRVRNWTGEVLSLSATSGGHGILRVRIAENTELSTGGVEAFDFDKTLIRPDTTVYEQLDALEEGMAIVFSGRFSRSKDDCVQEIRLTQKGGITHPLMLFKFTNLKPLE